MSRLQAILAAEQILNDERNRDEGRRRLEIADRREAERLRLQKEQSDIANERARIAIDTQNRQLDMADRRYQDDLALKDASNKQAQEHYSRFVIPYEESKLKDFSADNEQKLKAKQAYEATHSKYDASGLTDLIHGLESGGDKKNLLAKFNSIKGTYADDVKPSNGGYEVFAGGERIAYIAPEVRNSIMSRKHGGDVRNDGTIAGTVAKTATAKEQDPEKLAKAEKSYQNALADANQKIANKDGKITPEQIAIAKKSAAYNEKKLKELYGDTQSQTAPASEAAQNARNRRAFENLGKDNTLAQQANNGKIVIGAGGSFDEQAKVLKAQNNTAKLFNESELSVIKANPATKQALDMLAQWDDSDPDKAVAIDKLRKKISAKKDSPKEQIADNSRRLPGTR